MKPLLLLLLCGSVAANVWLLVTEPSKTNSGKATTDNASLADRAAENFARHQSRIFERLRSGDPAAVDELRALGLPKEVLRRIVSAEVSKLFLPRVQQLFGADYWNQPTSGSIAPEKMNDFLAIQREATELNRKLLGPDAVSEHDSRVTAFAGVLPHDKAAAVALIESDYSALLNATRGYPGRVLFPEDEEKIAYLAKERRADLAKVLTPTELFEYDIRQSSAARELRLDLAAFEPTEEEFRLIFAKRQEIDAKLGIFDYYLTPAQRAARREADIAALEEAKSFLGEARVADIVRAQSFDYRNLHAVGRRLGLPKENITAAYAEIENAGKLVRALERDPAIRSKEAGRAAVQAIEADTMRVLTGLLGEKGCAVYAKNNTLLTGMANFVRPPARELKPASSSQP